MKLIAPNQSYSNFIQNQKSNWQRRADGYQWLNQRELVIQQIQRSPLQKKQREKDIPSELCVEDIEVYADKKYMYCKGIVRSHGSQARSNLVVAVEWLDENQKALNTDWKRIDMQTEGKSVPLFPNTMRPFIVKAPLDRRVKWVKAYAFSGNYTAN
jgi:hypothetical protein